MVDRTLTPTRMALKHPTSGALTGRSGDRGGVGAIRWRVDALCRGGNWRIGFGQRQGAWRYVSYACRWLACRGWRRSYGELEGREAHGSAAIVQYVALGATRRRAGHAADSQAMTSDEPFQRVDVEVGSVPKPIGTHTHIAQLFSCVWGYREPLRGGVRRHGRRNRRRELGRWRLRRRLGRRHGDGRRSDRGGRRAGKRRQVDSGSFVVTL